jgi:hypothetical protein
MKLGTIKVTFKTPDAMDNAVKRKAAELDLEEDDEVIDDILYALKPFIKYGELITVEFDLDKGTACVVTK